MDFRNNIYNFNKHLYGNINSSSSSNDSDLDSFDDTSHNSASYSSEINSSSHSGGNKTSTYSDLIYKNNGSYINDKCSKNDDVNCLKCNLNSKLNQKSSYVDPKCLDCYNCDGNNYDVNFNDWKNKMDRYMNTNFNDFDQYTVYEPTDTLPPRSLPVVPPSIVPSVPPLVIAKPPVITPSPAVTSSPVTPPPPTVTPPTVTPPMITPPMVTPPIVTPPTVTPPIVAPMITPPMITLPIVTPMVTPPMITLPADTPKPPIVTPMVTPSMITLPTDTPKLPLVTPSMVTPPPPIPLPLPLPPLSPLMQKSKPKASIEIYPDDFTEKKHDIDCKKLFYFLTNILNVCFNAKKTIKFYTNMIFWNKYVCENEDECIKLLNDFEDLICYCDKIIIKILNLYFDGKSIDKIDELISDESKYIKLLKNKNYINTDQQSNRTQHDLIVDALGNDLAIPNHFLSECNNIITNVKIMHEIYKLIISYINEIINK